MALFVVDPITFQEHFTGHLGLMARYHWSRPGPPVHCTLSIIKSVYSSTDVIHWLLMTSAKIA